MRKKIEKKNFGPLALKNHVRSKNDAFFLLKTNALDRILGYKRTVLKEECLYILIK